MDIDILKSQDKELWLTSLKKFVESVNGFLKIFVSENLIYNILVY